MSARRSATARARFAVACAVAPLLAGGCAGDGHTDPAASPEVVLHDDAAGESFGAVDVIGLDEAMLDELRALGAEDPEWENVLAVRNPGATQPVSGRWSVLDAGIRFTPRFPPIPGNPWRVEFRLPRDGAGIDTLLIVGDVNAMPRANVVAVYPATDTVPMNLLRAYIRFSSAMSEGVAYDNIRLLDAEGVEVADAFLVLEHELWDPDRTRFTLLFDPGRIKQGLAPNEQLGLPLREGNDYTLVVGGDWTDALGRPLADEYRWSFHAGEADRSSPRVEDWTVVSPAAGTRDTLVVDALEALDQALFERVVTLRGPDGEEVRGGVRVADGGQRWVFTPAEPWIAGDYGLEIGTELEDLAGNNLRHLFDVDRSDRRDTGITGEVTRIPLVVRD